MMNTITVHLSKFFFCRNVFSLDSALIPRIGYSDIEILFNASTFKILKSDYDSSYFIVPMSVQPGMSASTTLQAETASATLQA